MLFDRLKHGPASGSRSYVLRQAVTVRIHDLPEIGGLSLWIPAPRHLPGVQHVRLVRCDPPTIQQHYLPDAGLLYCVPVLLHPLAGSLPLLQLEFQVDQLVDGLVALCDTDLVQQDQGAPGDPDLIAEWLGRLRIDPVDGAEACVRHILAAIEQEFAFTVWGPMTPKLLMVFRAGNVGSLTSFVALVLRRLGFATRAGAAQPLMMEGDHVTLTYPGSVAYEHRFLEWCFGPTGERGTFDLMYLHRWGFASTTLNTRSESFRKHLREIGEKGAAHLRRGVYPGDLLLAGVAPKSRFVNLNSYDVDPVTAPVDTELAAWRVA